MNSKFLLYVILLIAFNLSVSAKSDTVKIVFFLDSNIQQYKGVEWHRIAQKIPKGDYQKAILKIDLGCATYGCCAWDYTYRGFFSTKKDTSYTDIEVARLITPYSSFMRKNKQGYDSTWSHPYAYDVTDFLPLLKSDSIYYSALTGGWDDKGKFGFKHTVTLYLIKGNSSSASRVLPIYKNEYRYHDSTQFDTLAKSYKFKLTEFEKHAKFRMIFTGHDQQGEFSPISFYLRVNGKNIYSKRLWKTDCDKNAIQPQSGTWIFSRCNWCPGEKVQEIEVDLSPYLTKGENEIDIALGKIETKDSQTNANYLIEGNMITYIQLPKNDVELVAIVAPSSDPNYRLYNPIGINPMVKIRNTGLEIANDVVVDFWSELNPKRLNSFEFNQLNLAPFRDTIIELNADLSKYKTGEKLIFIVEQSVQNSNSTNDTLVSIYKSPPIFKSTKLIFEINTTGDSSVNKLTLKNKHEDYLIDKEYINNDKTYRDTIELIPGVYLLVLTDYDKNYECGDGLSFWYSSRIGKKSSGMFKIYDENTGKLLKVFNPDFGGKINYQFIIEKQLF
jgi:hypothetical protein